MSDDLPRVRSNAPRGLVWTPSRPGAPNEPWQDTDRWLDRMLADTISAGFTGVHAGTDAAAPARTDRILRRVHASSSPPELVVLVAASLEEMLRAAALAPDLPPSPSRRTASDSVQTANCVVLEIPRSAAGGARLPPDPAMQTATRRLGFAGWGIGYDEPPEPSILEPDLAGRPDWIRLPMNLIGPRGSGVAISIARSAGIPVLAADPFAQGRLDGSQLRGSPLDSTGRPSPADWSEVRREWAPVLALGFLTEGHRRTLAQAALQYLLGVPGVVGVLVPLSDPAGASVAGGALSAPPLSEADRDRIERLRGRVDGSRRTSRAPGPK